MVLLSRDSGYEHLEELNFSGVGKVSSLLVELEQISFLVQLFKIVTLRGDIDWLITNDSGETVTRFVAEKRNAVRWQIEDFHPSFRQLTGCQAQAQRNHSTCCYHAWVSLKLSAKRVLQTMYQIHNDLFSHYLKLELSKPHVKAI